VVTVSLNFDFHLLPGLNWPTFAAVLRVKNKFDSRNGFVVKWIDF